MSTSCVIKEGGGEGGGGAVFFFFFVLSPSCLSSVSQLSSFRSPPGMVCVMAPLSSLSHCPREIPHTQSQHQAGDAGFSLVCLYICLRAPEECLAVCAASCGCVCVCVFVCLCKFLAALTHRPSNTEMLLLV